MELVVRSRETSTCENWLFFAGLFRRMGLIKEAQLVLNRGVTYSRDGKERLGEEWLKYEEIAGSAESVLSVQSKLRTRKKGGAEEESIAEETKEQQ